MSRNRKGITGVPGLMFFTFVVAITVGAVYLISLIPLVNNIISIKGEVQILASQDDRGTALAAFLASDAGKGSCAEVLGAQAADGVDAGLDDALEATLSKMDPKGRVAVYDANALKKDYNSVGDNFISADLALPGIRKGEVRVS